MRSARVAAILCVLGAVLPTAAAAELPVRYSPVTLITGGFTPDQVAGANDFTCKPSAAHPDPVVLVHGLGATLGDNWATLSPLLKNNGFCVFGLTYGRQAGFPYVGGVQRMEDSSKELAAFVDKVLAATGAQKVDLLGHSEGTVMPRWYLSFLGGAAKVDKYVQLAPLWDGTRLAGTDTLLTAAKMFGLDGAAYQFFAAGGCGSCPEFVRGSDYLARVNAAGPAVPGVTYTEIATKYDELVIPYTSGFVDAPNVANVLLQDVCPTDYSEHLGVAYSPVVAQLVLNALDPAHARLVPCTTVYPTGTPDPPPVGLAPDTQPAAPTTREDPTRPTGGSSTPGTCALSLRLPLRRGERVRRVTVLSGTRRLAVRRGTALQRVRVTGLAPGVHHLRVRLQTRTGARTVRVTRTVRCPAR